MHYPVDAEKLQRLLPAGLLVDTHQGTAYVGVVAISELGISPAGPLAPFLLRPLLPLLRVSHHAVNVRTYVKPAGGGPTGVFFFSLDCSHVLASLGARLLFNLPYRVARIRRSQSHSGFHVSSTRRGFSDARLHVTWDGSPEDAPHAAEAGSLASFFCERYRPLRSPPDLACCTPFTLHPSPRYTPCQVPSLQHAQPAHAPPAGRGWALARHHRPRAVAAPAGRCRAASMQHARSRHGPGASRQHGITL
jgi:hypothetical protein